MDLLDKTWETISEDNIINVVPNNDLKPHIEKSYCVCKPRLDRNMIIHNSFDGREFFEPDNRAVKIL